MAAFRDRDVRNAMRDLADATGAFDIATCGGLPEARGQAGDQYNSVYIDPLDWTDESPYDDPDQPILVRTATVKVTISAIAADPVERDEAAERLCDVLANAWNGVALGGVAYPDKSQFTTWRWLNPIDVERRVEAKFTYQYEVGGFRDFSTSE